jgi:hypothetical protein
MGRYDAARLVHFSIVPRPDRDRRRAHALAHQQDDERTDQRDGGSRVRCHSGFIAFF